MSNKKSVGKAGTKNEKSSAEVLDNSKLYSRLKVVWVLSNFSSEFVKTSASASVIDSHPFEINMGWYKTKWFLRIYPNGIETKKSCVGIHLVKKSEYLKNYEYSCRFSIVKDKKEVMSKQFKARPSENEPIGKGYGFMLFLSHGELFNWFDKFIDDSNLTIHAEIVLSRTKIMNEEKESNEVQTNDAYESTNKEVYTSMVL